MSIINKSTSFWMVLIVLLNCGCKKIVDVAAPVDKLVKDNVFTSDQTAISSLTGIYGVLGQPGVITGSSGISILTGLSADEFTLGSTVSDNKLISYYTNSLVSTSNLTLGADIWSPFYTYIYYCNSAMEGLSASTALTESVKRQLLGEAKFMRAFFYYYLVNLYGDVPIALSTDYKVNSTLNRASKAQVYLQIINDLNEAKDLLSADFLDGNLKKYVSNAERVRPTRWAAMALLSRVYLFTEQWSKAEEEATNVITNSTFFTLSSSNNAFLKASAGNNEAIWQLQPIGSGKNTEEAQAFVLTGSGPNNNKPVYLSSQLLSSFESGDLRKAKWIDSVVITGSGQKLFYPGKYKNLTGTVTEYLTILRLAEQYLIRAEARTKLNNLSGAISDIDKVRVRAGISLIASTNPAISQTPLLNSILHERQVELFSEWGHRWIDLKRTSNIDAVMSVVTPLKSNGQPWQSYQQLYPLPFSDILKNSNLRQNLGY
jgi:hypothetical protein